MESFYLFRNASLNLISFLWWNYVLFQKPKQQESKNTVTQLVEKLLPLIQTETLMLSEYLCILSDHHAGYPVHVLSIWGQICQLLLKSTNNEKINSAVFHDFSFQF